MKLADFIASNPDSRELKRAIVVQMRLKGLKHREIESILGVPSSYISRWEHRYQEQGLEGLRLGYQGSRGYLSDEQRHATLAWIQREPERTVSEVMEYVEREHGVVYQSWESYYQLLKDAGMSWHQGKKKARAQTHRWWRHTTKRLQSG